MHSGTPVPCGDLLDVPPISHCRWLQAVAFLRKRYLAAHGGQPSLQWFEMAEKRRYRRVNAPVHLHVAIHWRRGDLLHREPGRALTESRVTAVIHGIAIVLALLIGFFVFVAHASAFFRKRYR